MMPGIEHLLSDDPLFALVEEQEREAMRLRAELRKAHIGEALWMLLATALAVALCIVLANERAGEIAAWLHGVARWLR
jgi:hypothetical protein